MRIGFFFLLSILALFGVGLYVMHPYAIGSGHLGQNIRYLPPFTKIKFQGNGSLHLKQGPREQLILQGDDNLLGLIQSRVENQTLYLSPPPHSILKRPLRFQVTLQSLEDLEIEGVARVKNHGSPLQLGRLHLAVKGAAKIALKTQLEYLNADISGSANLQMAGSVDHQNIVIRGAARFDALDFISQTTTIAIRGSGQALLHAKDLLSAEIGGAGEILYRGTPSIREHISGVGRIKPHKTAIEG